MLNIVMNSPELELGPELQAFKQATKDLSPPLRGYRLSTSTFIRSIHNSFARYVSLPVCHLIFCLVTNKGNRPLDTLNADLALQNEYDDAKKKRGRLSLARKTTKKKLDNDAAYHFVAYVSVDGQVWELDGLESKPVCIGMPVPLQTLLTFLHIDETGRRVDVC